jgi:hypothetical protein
MSIHVNDLQILENFPNKVSKTEKLVVPNLTQVQRAVSKTETTSSFELNSGIMNRKQNQLVVSNLTSSFKLNSGGMNRTLKELAVVSNKSQV